MSNLLLPVEAQLLSSVTGGATIARSSSSDQLLSTLQTLQTTLANQNNNHGGFSATEALMLGLMMSQRNNVVFVHRPFW
ncbi:MAG TPA: hypothetical protein VFP84_11385 [Kofleriaceae bacterium]|nr:hypothetical protein [Kofleriaceae bacterium]